MKIRTVIATATTAAVLATSGVALAGAAAGTSSPSPSDHPAASTVAAGSRTHPGLRRRARVHLHRARCRAGAIVAETIGVDRATLREELRSGKTIAEIAAGHGVQPQAVIDALVAAANERIDAAVARGRISAERAANIEGRVAARITRIVNEWHPRKVRTSADL